ncbi:MAG: hypothetical protein AMK73_02485, partial [Planctomycetes bacterium SM23_32]
AAARRRWQLTAADAPAADVVGGTLGRLPPAAGQTADDLVVFATACMMDVDAEANLVAAQRAAAYLMQLQFLPENAYYLRDPDGPVGGFREGPGSNVIRLRTAESALRGLVALSRLQLLERESSG